MQCSDNIDLGLYGSAFEWANESKFWSKKFDLMRDKSWLQSREMDSQGPRIITMAIGLWVSNEARVYVIYI